LTAREPLQTKPYIMNVSWLQVNALSAHHLASYATENMEKIG